jgi:hypothetical protein
LQQLLPQLGQLAAEDATHLVDGHTVRGPALRGDEVGHGLGLREVHLAGGKGALGELAPSGGTAAGIDEGDHHLLLNPHRPVARDLDHIFARKRVRGAKNGEHHLVEQLALRVDNAAQVGGVAGHGAERGSLPAPSHRVDSLRAAHTHNGDAAHAVGRRHRHNSIIVDIHRSIIFITIG